MMGELINFVGMVNKSANDPVFPATVCRICKTLEIDIPLDENVQQAKNIVDIAHNNHSKE